MGKIGIIIGREFYEKVRKKSFIITTILMPILMLAMMAAPALIMAFSTTSEKEVIVIDQSNLIASNLKTNEELKFTPMDLPLDSARKHFTEAFGILYIGKDIVSNPNNVKLYTNGPSSMMLEGSITGQIKQLVEDERLKHYNIENINEILNDVKAEVSMQTFRNDKEEEESTSSITSYALALGLGFTLYMFIMIYGNMVMTTVIEEKNNRVLEVMVSSVSPFQMMLGKILGIALVAVTQILIWAALMSILIGVVMPMIIPAEIMTSAAALNSGTFDASTSNVDIDMIQALSVLSNIGYIFQLLLYFALFLIGGFLLYAGMYSAVGSSVDNIQDASQLQTPLVLPIILSMILMVTVINDPDSQLGFWASMIPFTSPVVMLARIPFGIPTWEIILSLVILYISFVIMVWFAAKIYRVGIFMYGKKPSLKELYKWTKYKY